MKTKSDIIKDYRYCLQTDGEIFESILIDWLDCFGLYAIELIGKDEKETEIGLFGEKVLVPERRMRNEFRAELRKRLRLELFK